MLSYEVTIRVDDPALAQSLEAYMTATHVPEVFATGCFLDAHFERLDAATYRSRYTVVSQETLDGYVRDHAPRLREDFARHFPRGVTLTRAVWESLWASDAER